MIAIQIPVDGVHMVTGSPAWAPPPPVVGILDDDRGPLYGPGNVAPGRRAGSGGMARRSTLIRSVNC